MRRPAFAKAVADRLRCRCVAASMLLVAGLATAFSSAQAQSPEKFEQVVPRAQPAPPKPQPRAAPAKPPEPAPAPAAPAPLPLDQQPPVVELKRKAQAKEAENGFCLQTGWPDVSRATRLDVIAAGQADLWLGDKACGLTRAMSVVTEEERRCVNMVVWRCRIAAACEYLAVKYCKQDDGLYYQKKPE